MHLTNSPSDPYSVSAESAGAEAAGAPDEIEIEITPEMIRAGEMAVLDCVGDIRAVSERIESWEEFPNRL